MTHTRRFPTICAMALLALSTPAPAQTPAAPAAAYQAAERGPNHTVWRRAQTAVLPDGRTVDHTDTYTELASGLNYWDPALAGGRGGWAESREEIEVFEGSAVARQGPYQVLWAANPNTAEAVNCQLPDGQRLTSHVLCLSYFDPLTGESALLGQIRDCVGVVQGNQVIYTNAFEGDVEADLCYTYARGKFSQTVVIRQSPPPPQAYGLSERAELEVLTEFIASPEPDQQGGWSRGRLNSDLDFGPMRMGRGRAFSVGTEDSAPPTGTPVHKSWQLIEQRQVLIESVPHAALRKELGRLPIRQAGVKKAPQSGQQAPLQARTLPPRPPASGKHKGQGMRLALAAPRPGPGVVIDYELTGGAYTNYSFLAGSTYLINGGCNLHGETRLESAVLKFTIQGSLDLVDGAVKCLTDTYAPCVFTSKDDNSIGATVTGSTGNPTNRLGWPLFFEFSPVEPLQHLRFAHVEVAIFASAQDLSLRHCQFVDCNYAVYDAFATVRLENALLSRVNYVFAGDKGLNLQGSHLTLDQCGTLASMSSATSNRFYFTNSVVVNLTNWGLYESLSTNAVAVGTNSAVFQSAGGAAYYLAANSTLRDAGVTNLSPMLLQELKTLTTFPPARVTNAITANTTWGPQAGRDTNAPDCGYHYAPMDYLISRLRLTNATLLLTNGVAVGYDFSAGAGAALTLDSGAKLLSRGEAGNWVHLTRTHAVQERATNAADWYATFEVGAVPGTYPEVRLRFTDLPLFSGGYYHLYGGGAQLQHFVLQDCQMRGGAFNYTYTGTSGRRVAFTNSLFEGTGLAMGNGSDPITLTLFNNLFKGGGLTIRATNTGSWTIKDNLFDGITVTNIYSGYPFISHGYNGYRTNCSRLTPTQASDVVANTAYEIGPLGRYYLVSGSPFIDRGSRNATNAGFYHYTTTTDQVKEGNSPIDIGLHYVAVNANGDPVDSNTNGLPDYIEDASGCGIGNQPPGFTAPASLAVFEDVKTTLSGISLSDSDAGSGHLQVSLSVTNGILALSTTNGLVFLNGTNGSSSSMTVEGALDDLNAGLATLQYLGVTNYFGSDRLSLLANDLDYTRYDGPKTGTSAVAMTINAVNDLPVIILITPTNGFSAAYGTPVQLAVTNWDVDGTVTNVEYFANTNSIGISTNSSFAWNGGQLGSNYMLFARATDNQGATNDSNPVNISVDADTDGDGVSDITEARYETDPNDYYNGVLPNLSIVSGNFQSGFSSMALANPLVVKVTDKDGCARVRAPVSFAMDDGGGTLSASRFGPSWTSSLAARTDEQGQAFAWCKLPAVTNILTLVLASATNQANRNQVFFVERTSELESGIVQIEAGDRHNFARFADGTVIAWGANQCGQLGLGFNSFSSSPTVVTNLHSPVLLTAGHYHSLALLSNGTALAWGTNDWCELGYDPGLIASANVPIAVSGLTGIAKLVAGGCHNLALLSNGTLKAWGYNGNGQLGDGTSLNRANPVTVTITGLDNVVDISAAEYHSLALKADGTAVGWGSNSQQQLPPQGQATNIAAISAGGWHSMALRSNGTVVVWSKEALLYAVPSGATNIVTISAASQHCLALRADGVIFQWGFTNNYQGVAPSGTNYIGIYAGGFHSLALTSDHNVVGWGYNDYGQSNALTNLAAAPVFQVYTPLK